MIRLQKYMAMCGVASRRESERMIARGLVCVNGEPIADMGRQISDGDRVEVEGVQIRPASKRRYILLNKPPGCVSTVSDPFGRPTVIDFVTDAGGRLFPVGRLDFDTRGALIMTDDGEFANRVTHPSREVSKTYIAMITGIPHREALQKLRAGIMLDGKITAPAHVELAASFKGSSRLRIIIREGRNRQVRRMLEAVGHRVIDLERVSVGGVILGKLPPGKWRRLTPSEINSFNGE